MVDRRLPEDMNIELEKGSADHSAFSDNVSIVAAISDRKILENNLLRSGLFSDQEMRLHEYYNQVSASAAYNRGLADTRTDYIVFVHQDVYLPRNWLGNLRAAIGRLSEHDPAWAIIGAFGKAGNDDLVGHVWSSGLGCELGETLRDPIPVVAVDELLIVMRRVPGLKFDDRLPGFHLYGTDIVHEARKLGMTSYVCDLPVVHNSKPVQTLAGGYTDAYRFMQRKWKADLPLKTIIAPITRNGFGLLKARAKISLTRRQRLARSVPQTSDPRLIAEKIGIDPAG